VCIRYRKTVRKWQDIENNFYTNGSLNKDLVREIWKDIRKCSYIMIFQKKKKKIACAQFKVLIGLTRAAHWATEA
jgi:hypothetical protein